MSTISESAGTAPESPGTETAVAGEGPPVTTADILVGDASSGEVPAGAIPEGDGTAAASAAAADAQESAALNLGDVFSEVDAADPNLGAWLTVETSGSDTVISVDADGGGVGAAVPVITLQNVTNVTLADLLNNTNT